MLSKENHTFSNAKCGAFYKDMMCLWKLKSMKGERGYYVIVDLRSMTSKPHAWRLLRAWFKLSNKRKHKKAHGNKFHTRYRVRSKDGAVFCDTRMWLWRMAHQLKSRYPSRGSQCDSRHPCGVAHSLLYLQFQDIGHPFLACVSTWAHVHRTPHNREGINNKTF